MAFFFFLVLLTLCHWCKCRGFGACIRTVGQTLDEKNSWTEQTKFSKYSLHL